MTLNTIIAIKTLYLVAIVFSFIQADELVVNYTSPYWSTGQSTRFDANDEPLLLIVILSLIDYY